MVSQAQSQSVDEYIESYPKEVQEILKKIRKIVKNIVPNGEEVISYGIPTVKLNGKYVVYFAAFKKHISLYPVIEVPEAFKKKIESFIKGRGTMQFPLGQPIPYELIEQFVKYNLAANLERTKKK